MNLFFQDEYMHCEKECFKSQCKKVMHMFDTGECLFLLLLLLFFSSSFFNPDVTC